MKTKLITLFLCLCPLLLYAQDYQKEGDELFQQAQYEKAIKKYNAYIAYAGDDPAVNKRIAKAKKCNALLSRAKSAEHAALQSSEAIKYEEASKLYKELYLQHSLASYKLKASQLQEKGNSIRLEQEEHRRELERVERDREEKRIAAGKAEAERIAAKKAQEEQERRKQYAFLYEAMDKPHEHSSSKGKIPDSREYIRVKNSITEIPPDNEIWYKSEDEETIVLKNYAGQLISNTYVNGKGIYRFAEPVTVIVKAQFRNANFKSIILPQTVKRIESYGFDNCSNLRTIILSKDLQSLQTDVFCQISANIFFLGPVPKMGWRAMWNLKSNSVIYYPEAEDYSSLINNFPSAPVQEKGAKMKFVSTKY